MIFKLTDTKGGFSSVKIDLNSVSLNLKITHIASTLKEEKQHKSISIFYLKRKLNII